MDIRKLAVAIAVVGLAGCAGAGSGPRPLQEVVQRDCPPIPEGEDTLESCFTEWDGAESEFDFPSVSGRRARIRIKYSEQNSMPQKEIPNYSICRVFSNPRKDNVTKIRWVINSPRIAQFKVRFDTCTPDPAGGLEFLSERPSPDAKPNRHVVKMRISDFTLRSYRYSIEVNSHRYGWTVIDPVVIVDPN